MLRLVLENFGRYVNQTIDLPTYRLCTMTGRSGAGKTTIFYALIWVLTDCEVDNADPIRHGLPPNERVSVTLYWGPLTIYRQRKPTSFLRIGFVSATGSEQIVWSGDQAQAYLNKTFGSIGVIRCSSYLSVKSEHPMFSASAVEKLNLLRELALADQDPDILIEAAGQNIKQYQHNYTTEHIGYQKELKILNDDAQRCRWDLYTGSIEERQQIWVRCSALPPAYNAARADLDQNLTLQGKLDGIRTRLQAIPDLPPNQKSISDLEERQRTLLRIEQDWIRYQGADEQRRTAERLTGELAGLKPVDHVEDATPDKLPIIIEGWAKWNKIEEALKVLRIESFGSETRMELETILKYREFSSIAETARSLLENLSAARTLKEAPLGPVEGPSEVDLQNQASKLREQVWKFRQSKIPMNCPNCQASLTVDHEKLHPYRPPAGDLAGLETQIRETDQQLDRARKLAEARRALQAAETQKALRIAEMERALQIAEARLPKDWSKIKERYQLIRPEWQVLDNRVIHQVLAVESSVPKPEQTVEEFQLRMRTRGLREQLRNLQISSVDRPPLDLADVQASLRIVQSEIAEWRHLDTLAKQRSELKIEEAAVVDQIGDVGALRSRLESIQNDFNMLTAQIESWKISDVILERQRQLALQKEALDQTLLCMQDWVTIHQVIVDAKYYLAEQVVLAINRALQEIVPMLIHSVNMEITLKRELKSHQVKSEVGIVIRKVENGETIERRNLKGVSGGEEKRLSLALTLAFRMVTKTPLLLFDEVFSSLDPDFCNSGREAIREHLLVIPGTAMIINHHDVVGSYDNEIAVDENVTVR